MLLLIFLSPPPPEEPLDEGVGVGGALEELVVFDSSAFAPGALTPPLTPPSGEGSGRGREGAMAAAG